MNGAPGGSGPTIGARSIVIATMAFGVGFLVFAGDVYLVSASLHLRVPFMPALTAPVALATAEPTSAAPARDIRATAPPAPAATAVRMRPRGFARVAPPAATATPVVAALRVVPAPPAPRPSPPCTRAVTRRAPAQRASHARSDGSTLNVLIPIRTPEVFGADSLDPRAGSHSPLLVNPAAAPPAAAPRVR